MSKRHNKTNTSSVGETMLGTVVTVPSSCETVTSTPSITTSSPVTLIQPGASIGYSPSGYRAGQLQAARLITARYMKMPKIKKNSNKHRNTIIKGFYYDNQMKKWRPIRVPDKKLIQDSDIISETTSDTKSDTKSKISPITVPGTTHELFPLKKVD